MPFLLVFIGLLMVVTGTRNTHVAFARQVQSDFTGQGNFITWVVALGAVGSLGYIEKLRTFSHYFMALIIIGLVLSNKGFFAKFSQALATSPVAPQASPDSTTSAPNIDTAKAAATATVKDAATGNNPGSDMIGSLVAPYSKAFRDWSIGLTKGIFGN